MATVNGKAYTMVGGPGLLQNGTGGTANSAGGFESQQPDVQQFSYTIASGAAALVTANISANPYIANGTPVSFGWSMGPFVYTYVESTNLFTVEGLSDVENLTATGQTVLPAAGMAVVLVGIPPAAYTASVLPIGDPYNGITASVTPYYVIAGGLSGNSFELSATQGGSAVSASGGNISTPSANSMLYIHGGVATGLSPFVTYYMVSSTPASGTFEVSKTVGGSAITTSTVGGGLMAVMTQNMVAPQVAEGSGTQYQSYYQGGFRTGLQPGQAVASASSLSLDEDPQLAWQNVAGATCQTGNAAAQALGGTSGKGGAPAKVASPFGWGYVGGISAVTGGGVVYEEKAPVIHVDDNGKPETAEHRKARLTAELNALKEKGEPTAKENARKSVVEAALKELA